jgi:hypothetical protein
VHVYMVEECVEMLESRQVMVKSELSRSKLGSKTMIRTEVELESNVITLPQRTYNVDDNF